MKKMLKKILPNKLIVYFHYLQSLIAALCFGNPSNKLILIGITGTKGKTTCGNFIWSALQAAGVKTGLIGTANIRIGTKESLNKFHMTMPGPYIVQKLLKEMVQNNCQVCIMEVTSEGIKQFRHKGINFDIGVFTNLTPEHLPSHENSFEKYKEAKGIFFNELSKNTFHKIFGGETLLKTSVINIDSEHSGYFYNFKTEQRYMYSINKESQYRAEKITEKNSNVKFSVNNVEYELNILGQFNVYNALPAIAIGDILKLDKKKISQGLLNIKSIPGRMEIIPTNTDYTVIVDYAHEGASMQALMDVAKNITKNTSGKIIVLLGAEGGGRDKNKRPVMGKIVGEIADYIVISNVDPYEDDPQEIIESIAAAAIKAGKIRQINLFAIQDRREGIAKALSLAKKNDLVLITGKGAEQSITINGKKYPWDDRSVVREELEKSF